MMCPASGWDKCLGDTMKVKIEVEFEDINRILDDAKLYSLSFRLMSRRIKESRIDRIRAAIATQSMVIEQPICEVVK